MESHKEDGDEEALHARGDRCGRIRRVQDVRRQEAGRRRDLRRRLLHADAGDGPGELIRTAPAVVRGRAPVRRNDAVGGAAAAVTGAGPAAPRGAVPRSAYTGRVGSVVRSGLSRHVSAAGPARLRCTMRTLLRTRLRPMTAADIPQVLDIERESFPSAWPQTAYKRELTNRVARYLVLAEVDDDDAGAVAPGESHGLLTSIRRIVGTPPQPERHERILGFIGLWLMVGEAHIV